MRRRSEVGVEVDARPSRRLWLVAPTVEPDANGELDGPVHAARQDHPRAACGTGPVALTPLPFARTGRARCPGCVAALESTTA